jgi:hypothetical protein
MPASHLRTRSRSAATLLVAMFAAILAVTLAVPGSANAHLSMRAVPPPPKHPTRADQIQNIDLVRTAIKAYYGDTVSGVNPDGTPQHLPSPTGSYAKEVKGVEAKAEDLLQRVAAGNGHHVGKLAVVLDVDDTSLNTYNYEIYSNFAYNPTTNAAFVNAAAFPAVFGMPKLATTAAAEGYTVFFLTGRPETQRAATETNLQNAGYPVIDSQVYLKDLTKPIYASCYSPTPPTCTTIQYKSLTRAYIESQGYDIVADLGDQYSDLRGGYADQTFKLPNPMYYLP